MASGFLLAAEDDRQGSLVASSLSELFYSVLLRDEAVGVRTPSSDETVN